jgi:hypothetical protein
LTNLFRDLSKHLSGRHEDFLTNSFIYLLNYLLENERPLAIGLLNFICGENSEFTFKENEKVVITTQKFTSEGTPDIEIKSDEKCIYVEVKHDSGLGKDQIERYKKALRKERAAIKKILLLTRFTVDLQEANQERVPDRHIRWYQIHKFLENIEVKDRVGKFLKDEFIKFLEVKQMAIQRVGWEYTNGIRAFLNLINMIETAIEELRIRVYQKTAGLEQRGYYLEDKDEFCGIYYDEPDSVYIFLYASTLKPNDKNFPYTYYEQDKGVYFELSLEDTHFFALQKDEQFNKLKEFISTCHTEVQRLKKSQG